MSHKEEWLSNLMKHLMPGASAEVLVDRSFVHLHHNVLHKVSHRLHPQCWRSRQLGGSEAQTVDQLLPPVVGAVRLVQSVSNIRLCQVYRTHQAFLTQGFQIEKPLDSILGNLSLLGKVGGKNQPCW